MQYSTWRKGKYFISLLAFFIISSLFAGLTSKTDARKVVIGWLKSTPAPLKTKMQKKITSVKAYKDKTGSIIYYIVSFKQGYVVVSADDLIEPIIAFSPVGKFDPDPRNPLFSLVETDLPKRLKVVKDLEAKAKKANKEFAASKGLQKVKTKWKQLIENIAPQQNIEMGESSIDDVRVDSLVDSRWNQSTEGGNNCYNYYTPNNYVCGCVATAMAQLLRFHQHPSTGVGTASYTVYVDGTPQSQSLRGGDGAGGAYDWSNMVLNPDGTTTLTERQAIGALTVDAGTSVNMQYAAAGSGAYTLQAADAFVDIFGYSNAIKGYDGASELVGNGFNEMANPNLDAGLPVILGITGDGGHAIVCDGYGYNTSTLYHHLNMGWGGSQDAWYNLPTINTAYYNFNKVYKCVYNVFTSGTGEIISGRVTDPSGNAISGITVTADDGGTQYTDDTDSNGIYAIHVPSATSFTLSCTGGTSKNVTTGTSVNNGAVGNLWGEDFTSTGSSSISIDDVTVAEGNAGTTTASFTVTLSSASNDKVITVDYTTNDGTATAGSDYTATAGTLTFNIGDTTKTIDVTVNGDLIDEDDETFTVDLSNATNASIDTSQGTCTITDEDTGYDVVVNNGTGDGTYVNTVTVTIVADNLTGMTFSKWSGPASVTFANENAATSTFTMPNEAVTVTASYTLNPATAESITYGSLLDIYASQISDMDAEFCRKPKIYGVYTDPVKKTECSTTTKIISKISTKQAANKLQCMWNRCVYLYNKKDLMNANKGGTSTSAYLAAKPTENANLECTLYASAQTAAKEKLNPVFRGTLIVPPTITSIERWDGGGAVAAVHTNSKVLIKGTYFGIKAPTVCLEYTDATGAVKQIRLKILKPYPYDDFKGCAEKSCMDLTSGTGASQVTVQMPSSWWSNWTAGAYDLVIYNKTGLDTASVTTLANGGGNPPVANDDAQTLYAGCSNYEIDVLTNDQDADADDVNIVVGNAGFSTQQGKIKASKGKIKYTPPKTLDVSAADFTDTFTYSLDDGHGGTSASATVTVTFKQLTVTSITRWDGNVIAAGGVNPGAIIIVNGTDFGVKAPTIFLEDATGQILKLKVYGAENEDYKGKANKSYTNLTTGVSKAYVQMPTSWKWPTGTAYTFEVNNKIGGDDDGQTLTLSDPSGNTAPTANDDTENITGGEACYMMDVLANDTDTESDKVTIVLTRKTSDTQGAKLRVDKKTNQVKYTRAAGVLCPFTDIFTYSLVDSQGATSGTATVTVNATLAP